MKINAAQFLPTVGKKPLPPLVMIYGDDAGAVRQLAQACLDSTGIDLQDPFAAEKIDVNALAAEPGKLLESAQTVSLMGGLRVIQLTGGGSELTAGILNGVTEGVKLCLQAALNDALIVCPLPSLTKTHALTKAVESASNAVAVRCFTDQARDVSTLARDMAQKAGKTVQNGALQLLSEHLGADRDITRMELEKLILYGGDAPEITAEDVLSSLCAAPASNVFKLCDAVGMQDTAKVEQYLTLLTEEGQDLNQIFNLVVRHLRRLAAVQDAKHRGLDDTAACRAVTPPVTFGQREFMQQVNRYPAGRLKQLIDRALSAQTDSRSGLLDGDIPLRRAVVALGV